MIKIINDTLPTVWVFGDSFSEDVVDLPNETLRVKYVNEYLNGIPYKIWQEQVADKLGYNYRNYAAIASKFRDDFGDGNSNDHMYLTVCEYCNQFKRDDIIIIGYTNIGRFQVMNENKWPISYLLSMDLGEKTDYLSKMYVDRHHPYYAAEIHHRFKILEVLSEIIGFTIYYWDWSDTVLSKKNNIDHSNSLIYQITNDIVPIKDILPNKEIGLGIQKETNGEIEDNHWGKNANNVLYNLFYPHILSKVKNNYD